MYPVNALAYHPVHVKSFATGGGDGVVCIWDESQKKRLRIFPPYKTGISSVCFNSSGNLMAISSSYSFEQGDREYFNANL